jgi:hypothetical protein
MLLVIATRPASAGSRETPGAPENDARARSMSIGRMAAHRLEYRRFAIRAADAGVAAETRPERSSSGLATPDGETFEVAKRERRARTPAGPLPD